VTREKIDVGYGWFMENATAVNQIGAVSPIARAMLNTDPVRMPGIAVGKTTVRIMYQRVAPRARAPSRNEPGTARRASSAARMRIGNESIANVQAPERSDTPKFSATTNRPTPTSPKTIEGTPASVLTPIRIARTHHPFHAYSESQIADPRANGNATTRDPSVR